MGRQMGFVVAAMVAMMLAGTTASALAQDAGFKVGLVNIARVQKDYVDLQNEQQDLEKWLGVERGFFNTLTDFIFLSSDNFDEVKTLLKKTGLSDEEKVRLAELRTISDDKDKRFRELGAQTERSTQEEDEFNSLQDVFKARTGMLDEMWKKTLTELTGMRDAAVTTLMDKVKEAISVEAQAQGMALVVDADATFFGGTDITEDVLKRLPLRRPRSRRRRRLRAMASEPVIISRWVMLALACALVGCGEREPDSTREPLQPGRGYAYTAVLMSAHPQYQALARLDMAAIQLDQADEIELPFSLMGRRLPPVTLTETLAYGANPTRLAQWRQWWEERYTEADELADGDLPRDLWAGLEWEREQGRKQVNQRMATAEMGLSRHLAKVRAGLVRQMQERLNNLELDLSGRESDVLKAAGEERARIWESINRQVELERESGEGDLVKLRAQLEAEAAGRVDEARRAAEETARERAEQVARAGETLHSEMAGELEASQWQNPVAAELAADPSEANRRLTSGEDTIGRALATRRDVLERQRMQVRAAAARLRIKLKRETEVWAIAVARRNDVQLQLLPGGRSEGRDMTDAIAAELESVWRGTRD